MSGISTKNVKGSTGGGLSKVIEPGEQILKINTVKLVRYSFMEKDSGYFLILDVETKPIKDFEGFFIDKDNESLGRHEGQVGQIKTNTFYYKDSVTKSGVSISRDMEILKQIKVICSASDALDWFDKVDGKFATIEDFIDGFNKEAPYKDKYFKFCIAGKEYSGKNGYIQYDLMFPKYQKGKVVFEPEDVKVSKIISFDETKHIIKLTPKQTNEFSDVANEMSVSNKNPDLKGPDFEL